ncbi:MAG: TIGR02452 family protein [Planctomycetes bacterium]|nr:TIGR02452 family protein [Planctomycetota bacterium]
MSRKTDQAWKDGRYCADDGTVVEIAREVDACKVATRLIKPDEWPAIEREARSLVDPAHPPLQVTVTGETTLAALRRLVVDERRDAVAALNFASARTPGGGYRTGANAQEETLARGSALVASLERAPRYYEQNRASPSALYTDHAIWSPAVPFFADDAGVFLATPYRAGVVTMPAPNRGAITAATELQAVPEALRRRIRCVLALAAQARIRHLVLGAWGCGVFRNPPETVAPLFREALSDLSWSRAFTSVVFAIYDPSPQRATFAAFQRILTPPA